MLPNASYFALTATPKNKTLEIFGDAFPEGDAIKHRPFHSYTMKQANQEGFILDVLRYYTPVNSYYRLIKTVDADPEFDTKRATKKLRRYVESNDHAIHLNAEIMVDHFHEQVLALNKIGGQARAMVVTSRSRAGHTVLQSDAALWRKDTIRRAMPADRQRSQRQVHPPRRPRRCPVRAAQRCLASRRSDQRGEGPTQGGPGAAARGEEDAGRRHVMRKQQSVDPEPILVQAADDPLPPLPPLTAEEVAAIEARAHERREYWNRVHAALRRDAQSCARSMCHSPLFGKPRRVGGYRRPLPRRLPVRPVVDGSPRRRSTDRSPADGHAAGNPPWSDRGDECGVDGRLCAHRHGSDRVCQRDARSVDHWEYVADHRKRDVRAADAAGEVEDGIWRQAGGHTWDRCRRACDTAARIAAAAVEYWRALPTKIASTAVFMLCCGMPLWPDFNCGHSPPEPLSGPVRLGSAPGSAPSRLAGIPTSACARRATNGANLPMMCVSRAKTRSKNGARHGPARHR